MYDGVALLVDGELLGISAKQHLAGDGLHYEPCLLYTSPSPRDGLLSRMPSSA